MNPKNILPLIVTDKLAETKKFYVQQAGFELVTEMEGYQSVVKVPFERALRDKCMS